MQPCKSINCFFDDTFRVPVEVQMQRVYDGGFRHVDMNFWDWSHDPASPFRADNWKEWVRGIAEAAARIGLKFTQAHSHVYNFYQFPETNIHKEMVMRSIEGAGMLGIPWIVMHCSTRPDFAENGSTEQRIADNIAFFREMAAFAAQFGVGIAVENASGVYTAQELIAIVDGVGLNNIGICWDTGHANMKTPDQCAQLRALGHRVHALHIADNMGERDEHTAPFYGNIDWPPIIQTLREIGYDGDLTFEAHTFIRRVPESCKNDAVRLLCNIGHTLLAAE